MGHLVGTEGDWDKAKFETLPATPQAQALDGSYSYNPKPAVEVVLVCQKPMRHKTYVDQALDWQGQREKALGEIAAELKKQGIEKVEWENE